MWLTGRIHHSEPTRDRTGQAKPYAVHRVARHVDQTFEETDGKNKEKVREIDDNGDEPLVEKKNTEENEENGRQNPARREN